MESPADTDRSERRGERTVEVRILGQMAITREGVAVTLPTSQKVRALTAYLALAPRPVTRSRLCELLWDVPNDPRGELRWCLSKLRRLLDEPGLQRISSQGETVALDLTGCFVDVVEIARVLQQGIETFRPEQLRQMRLLFTGDFLESIDIDGCPEFNSWLTAQRRRFRGYHIALLEHLARSAPAEEIFDYLEEWCQLAPFDPCAHESLLNTLATSGRIGEGEHHVAATVRHFEAEGLDSSPIRDLWRTARIKAGGVLSVHAVSIPVAPHLIASRDDIAVGIARRGSIAVMPFADQTDPRGIGDSIDGLAHDIITRLAKLRSLFVIAWGTVFALHERGISAQEAARTLNVDYVVSGSIQRRRERLTVTVELAETHTARIVWTDDFSRQAEDALIVLDEIGDRIVSSIASEVEANERNRAILRPPSSLDAWEAYHRGLWHMYRFNRADNHQAEHFFELAVRLDPTFARGYAGLSFTHFQSAFQGWAEREHEIDRAFDAAGQSLISDDHDPAAHWAMGRALWLRGRQDQSIAELERAVELSPNFALAHYTLAFVHSQSGDPLAAIRSADQSRRLSPFDPLLFGMLASRAMALLRLGKLEEAADWGVKAAARPNAHAHIRAIAACCLALAGRNDEAQALVTSIHKTLPHYTIDDFLAAFRFGVEGAALFRKGAKRVGIG